MKGSVFTATMMTEWQTGLEDSMVSDMMTPTAHINTAMLKSATFSQITGSPAISCARDAPMCYNVFERGNKPMNEGEQ